MTFVPCRYPYPTQRGFINRLTLQLGVLWSILLIWILAKLSRDEFPAETLPSESVHDAVILSLNYPIYYMVLSWVISVRHWRRTRHEKRRAPITPLPSNKRLLILILDDL